MKNINKRRLRYGANNVILIIAAIVIFVLVNLLAGALSEKFPAARIDLTENGMFEIGDATRGVLDDLYKSGDKVTIYYMKGGDDENTYIKEVVLKYLAAGKNLKYELKRYNSDPKFVQDLGIENITEHSLVVKNETNGRSRVIAASEMFEYSGSGDQYYPVAANLESKLTNAIAYCISDEETRVCFTLDHGELASDEMVSVLQGENIDVSSISLKTGEIPDECKMLYIISPVYDFTADEINRLDSYLDRGGSVQLAVEPYVTLPRLQEYLKEWGVTLDDNIVVENDLNYRTQDPNSGLDVLFPQAEQVDVNSDLLKGDGRSRVFAMLCRGLSFEQDIMESITCERVFRTTRQGMAYKMGYDEDGQAIGLGDGEQGTYALALYLEKQVGENYDKTAKLLVAGSSSFWGVSQYGKGMGFDLTGLLSEGSFGNKRFFVGSAYEMLDLGGTRLTISSKSLRYTRLVMTEFQQKLYRIIFCFALPVIIILAGIVIWLKRRHL